MGKNVHDDVLDAALNIIKNNATAICACSQEPTTRTEAYTTYCLARDETVVSGEFTLSDGATSGRRLISPAKAAVTVIASGTMNHVAIVDGTRLLCTTTADSLALTVGSSTWDCPAIQWAMPDPV
jgi:hypothetical protein